MGVLKVEEPHWVGQKFSGVISGWGVTEGSGLRDSGLVTGLG